MGEDAVRMYEWFDRVGFAVDRVALLREFPDVAFHVQFASYGSIDVLEVARRAPPCSRSR